MGGARDVVAACSDQGRKVLEGDVPEGWGLGHGDGSYASSWGVLEVDVMALDHRWLVLAGTEQLGCVSGSSVHSGR